MCISLIADKYVHINLLVEQVFLSLCDGTLCAHEVYDFILTPRKTWKDARIIGISPHNLLLDGNLRIRSVAAPGAGGPDDTFYKDVVFYEADYDEVEHCFSLTLPAGKDEFVPETETYAGSVIKPNVRIPELIAGNKTALELMEECGTVFEIALGELDAGIDYAFRLSIDPKELQGIQQKRSQDIEELDEVLSNWVQDAVITCPKTCRFNFLHQVAVAREISEYAEAAGTIQTVVADASLTLLPVKRRQIVLILPKGAELIGKTSEGCTWAVSTHTLLDGRLAAIWAAGADQYWIDDPESVARRIYTYCKSWAVAQPKTKEEVSVAIAASHENCSLIIDSLCKFGALTEISDAKYAATDKSKAELDEVFDKVAACPEVAPKFRWKGYQIRYSVQYRYVSTKDRNWLLWLRQQRTIAFWCGITGTILGIISFLLALLT